MLFMVLSLQGVTYGLLATAQKVKTTYLFNLQKCKELHFHE